MGEDYDLIIDCCHCGELNGVPNELLEDLETIEELSIGIEDTTCTDDAVDYIFNELMQDGFVPTTAAIRAVLRYFHGFIVEQVKDEENVNEDI